MDHNYQVNSQMHYLDLKQIKKFWKIIVEIWDNDIGQRLAQIFC